MKKEILLINISMLWEIFYVKLNLSVFLLPKKTFPLHR